MAATDEVEIRSVKDKNVEYVVTDLSNDDYQEYYNGFANRVLWPILHFRLDLGGIRPPRLERISPRQRALRHRS